MKLAFRLSLVVLVLGMVAFTVKHLSSETFGAPGDVNNPFWTWGNQNSATAAWSNGAIIFVPDTTNQLEYLTHSIALPSTPYTFLVYVSFNAYNSSTTNGQGCFLGFRESSSSKISTLEIDSVQTTGTTTFTTNGGFSNIVRNSTSTTPASPSVWQPYSFQAGYLKIQNTGTNLIYTISPSSDGVGYTQLYTQAVTTAFTSAPNQLIIGGLSPGATHTTCTFDYLRRTQ